MVTVGEIYLLTATVMALVALVATVPVLRDIAREGRERLREGPVSPVENGGSGDGGDPDGVRCRHCEAVNEPGYTYCEACSRSL